MLVLEVKGCRALRRTAGEWYYGAGGEPDHRGPFRQASEAMHSVHERLVRHDPHLSGVPFVSAVCFPFIDFAEASEEWHPWQVIDRRRLATEPVESALIHVFDQARRRLVEHRARWFRPEKGEPTPGQCREIVRLVRPDFEFYESPRSRLRRLDEEVRRYTEEQFEALDAIDANPRLVFDGPAGTGKTLLAVEAARRASQADRRVLLLCFNRPLGRWLQDETADLRPRVTTRTLHEHMRLLAGIQPTPEQVCSRAFWQEELPELASVSLLDQVERADAVGARAKDVYDEIVLDEAQDVLRPSYLEFLDLALVGGLAAGRWRFFGDFTHQRLYDAAALALEEFMGPGDRGAGAVRCDLRVNCRNTPAVARLACACGGVVPGYRRVRRPDEDAAPEVRFWRDAADQERLLAASLDELYLEGFTGSKTAVISPLGDEHSAAAKLGGQPWKDRLEPLVREARFLALELVPVAVGQGGWPSACIPSDLDAVDLRSGHTRYSSIYRFKGLEAPAVIVTDIVSLDTPEACSLLYVACTRALHRLVILAHESVRGRLVAA